MFFVCFFNFKVSGFGLFLRNRKSMPKPNYDTPKASSNCRKIIVSIDHVYGYSDFCRQHRCKFKCFDKWSQINSFKYIFTNNKYKNKIIMLRDQAYFLSACTVCPSKWIINCLLSLSSSKLYYKVKMQHNTSSAQLLWQVIEHISSQKLIRASFVM